MNMMTEGQRIKLLEQVTGAFIRGHGREQIWPKLETHRQKYGQVAISTLVDKAEDLYWHFKRRTRATPPAATPVVANALPTSTAATPPPDLTPEYLAGLEALRGQLAEGGAENFIDDDLIDRMAGLVEGKLPKAHLDAFNADLKKAKGGTLTHADIAFIGCVHRRSILENNGESPFLRIKEAAEKFGFRDRPFDDRQVRYALTILSHAGFTKQVAQAVYSYKDKSKNKAGVWELTNDPYWTTAFEDTGEQQE